MSTMLGKKIRRRYWIRRARRLPEEMLTVQEIAARLKVHRDTVYAWLQSGDLRGFRLGGRRAGWRISERDLEEFLEKRRGDSV